MRTPDTYGAWFVVPTRARVGTTNQAPYVSGSGFLAVE